MRVRNRLIDSRLAAVNEASMEQTAVHFRVSVVRDTYGQDKTGYIAAATYPCRYAPKTTDEVTSRLSGLSQNQVQAVLADGFLYLPKTAIGMVAAKDYFELAQSRAATDEEYEQTPNATVALAPLRLDVVGLPTERETGVEVPVKLGVAK